MHSARDNVNVLGANGGPHVRVSSPTFGFSILMTSAPKSPSSIVQYGPAHACVWLYLCVGEGVRTWHQQGNELKERRKNLDPQA